MMVWWNSLNIVTQVFFCGAVFFGILFIWQVIASFAADFGGGHDISTGHDFAGGHDISAGHEVAGGHDAGADHSAGGHDDAQGGASHAPGMHAGGHGAPPVAAGSLHVAPTSAFHPTPMVGELTGDTAPLPAPGAAQAQTFKEVLRSAGPSFQLLSFRSILAFFTLFTWATALSLLNKGPAPGFFGTIFSILGGLFWGIVAMFCVAILFYLMARLQESGNANIRSCVGTTGSVYLDIPQDGLGEVRCTVSGAVTVVKARGAGGQPIKAGADVLILWNSDDNVVEVQPIKPLEKA
jgi:hypothetical protein